MTITRITALVRLHSGCHPSDWQAKTVVIERAQNALSEKDIVLNPQLPTGLVSGRLETVVAVLGGQVELVEQPHAHLRSADEIGSAIGVNVVIDKATDVKPSFAKLSQVKMFDLNPTAIGLDYVKVDTVVEIQHAAKDLKQPARVKGLII